MMKKYPLSKGIRDKSLILVLGIFLLALLVRFLSVYPTFTILGFDQVRDLFDARKIYLDHDLRIIGPTAGNNPNLHHGVLYLYYIMVPLLLFGANPIWTVLYNCFFNALTVFVLYYFGKSLFENKRVGIVAAFLVAVSYEYVQFAGWLSNPTLTLLTTPLFFYFLWQYLQGRERCLIWASLFLGVTIQFELFFVYLIPVGLLLWLIFRPKFPSFKVLAFSAGVFVLTLFTMILTEFKTHFMGIKSLVFAGHYVGGERTGFMDTLARFFNQFWKVFPHTIWPQNEDLVSVLGMILTGYLLTELVIFWKDKKRREGLFFLLVYLFSPAVMLLLGYHNAPWFLVGRPASVILATAYVLSKIRSVYVVIPILGVIAYTNLSYEFKTYTSGQLLLEPDSSSLMVSQLSAIDYTYTQSEGKPFTINSVTNPLYINAIWAYHYSWYGKGKYGSLPTWSGGDQLHPYNTLEKVTGKESYLFVLEDKTDRIPPIYRENMEKWASKSGELKEEKSFGGVLVQKWKITSPTNLK